MNNLYYDQETTSWYRETGITTDVHQDETIELELEPLTGGDNIYREPGELQPVKRNVEQHYEDIVQQYAAQKITEETNQKNRDGHAFQDLTLGDVEDAVALLLNEDDQQ